MLDSIRVLKKWNLIIPSVFALSAFAGATSISRADDQKEEIPIEKPAHHAARKYETGALIYQGVATAYGDAEAITDILDRHQVTYQLVSSDELNSMTLEDISRFGMIIWPGGYAGQMSGSLTAQARENIRKAVNKVGVSYVGICAGAFMAVSPAPSRGEDGPDWGLSLVDGDLLPYYHLEDDGIEDSMVQVQLNDGSSRSMVWWGGPYLPEYPHGVLARYEDSGQPAITQTWAGKGLVFLSGPHPEAPENWRTKLGLTDPDGLDQKIAWKLFKAALKQSPLPSMN
jgi:glutamine amidotransferase-like uncharacterized protein